MHKLIVAAVLVRSLPAFGEEIEESDLIGTWRIDTHFIIHEEDEITTTKRTSCGSAVITLASSGGAVYQPISCGPWIMISPS